MGILGEEARSSVPEAVGPAVADRKTFVVCRIFETLNEFRYMREQQALFALHLGVLGLTFTLSAQAAADAVEHLTFFFRETCDSATIVQLLKDCIGLVSLIRLLLELAGGPGTLIFNHPL